MPRRTPRPAALLLTVALPLAACGDDDDADPVETTTTTVGASTTVADDGTTTTTATASGPTIELEIAGGEPVGGVAQLDVALGDEVTIRVTADVTDEIHVHGYDLTAEVAPGAPAEIAFIADIPGQFEIELEEARLLVIELTVS